MNKIKAVTKNVTAFDYLILGKVKSTMADRGTDFRIRNVQIYNTAQRSVEAIACVSYGAAFLSPKSVFC